jgi:very-short-patch-repair endonuclease
MRLTGTEDARRRARNLRRQMTPPEIALWLALRRNPIGLRFRRQYPAGAYILDFYCTPAMLAVEVDGEAHSRSGRPEQDRVRDAWLASRGVQV